MNTKLMLDAMRKEQAEQKERERVRAEQLKDHCRKGWFIMCYGCRAVVAMGQHRNQEDTCLGASQEGWKEIRGNVYCPKCG